MSKSIEKLCEIFFSQLGYSVPKLRTYSEMIRDFEAHPESKANKELQELLKMFELGYDNKSDYDNSLKYGYEPYLKKIALTGLIDKEIIESTICIEFPTEDFNASAKIIGDGYICLLNKGLREFLYWFSLAASYNCKNYKIPSSTKVTKISNEWLFVLHTSILVLTHYTFGRDMKKRIPDANYSANCIALGGLLSSSMKQFIIAHELAHIQLGHINNTDTYSVESPYGKLDLSKKSYEQEFEADLYAQRILLEIAKNENDLDIVAGGICFLGLEILIRQYKEYIFQNKTKTSTTHPKSEERIMQLFTFLSKVLSNDDYRHIHGLLNVFQQVEDIYNSVTFYIDNDGALRIDLNK